MSRYVLISNFTSFVCNIKARCDKCKTSLIFDSITCGKCQHKICKKHQTNKCLHCSNPYPYSKSKLLNDSIFYIKYNYTICTSHFYQQQLHCVKSKDITYDVNKHATCIARLRKNQYIIGNNKGSIEFYTSNLRKVFDIKLVNSQINAILPHHQYIYFATDIYQMAQYNEYTKECRMIDCCSALNMECINDDTICLCGLSNSIYIYGETSKKIHKIPINIKGAFDLLCLNGSSLAYLGMNDTINIFDVNKEATQLTYNIDVQHEFRCECLCMYNGLLCVPSKDCTINLYSPQANKVVASLPGHTDTIRSIKLYKDTIVSCGDDNSILFWKDLKPYTKYTDDNLILGMA